MAKKNQLTAEEKLQEALIQVEEQPYKIPNNWSTVKFEKLAKFIDYRGKTPVKTESGIPLITAKNIKQGYINEDPREYIAEDDYEKWMTRGIPNFGDVIMTTEAPLGNVAQLNFTSKFALAQRAITFQVNQNIIEKKYLFYCLMSPYFQLELDINSTGTTVKGIKASRLKKIGILLPPIQEQKRIVAKLENLLSKTREAREKIEEAKETFELRRAGILHRAFTGELTAKWREENREHIEGGSDELLEEINREKLAKWEEECKKAEAEGRKKPKKPEITPVEEMEIPEDERPYELPEGWKWVRLENIFDEVKDKIVPKKDRNYKYIGLEHLKKGGGILKISNSEEINSTKTLFNSGDVLYGKLRPYLNKHSLVDFDGVCSTDILCYRAFNVNLGKILDYYFGLPSILEYANENSSGINLPRVSPKSMNKLLFPLATLKEQKEIVRIIEKLLEAEEKAKDFLDMGEQIDLIEKSILSKAFRGELNTGDESDEPAIELLKRVLEEKKR